MNGERWELRRLGLAGSSHPAWLVLIVGGLAGALYSRNLPEPMLYVAAAAGLLSLAAGLWGAGRASLSLIILALGLGLGLLLMFGFPHQELQRIPAGRRWLGIPFLMIWLYDAAMLVLLAGSSAYDSLARRVPGGGVRVAVRREPDSDPSAEPEEV